ncbi:MAG TPA: DUF748 domain-containing protein [Gammaproteobacteria bacterium]|nr:DUF748 domain-containing protein [Gammaproteobacteria bacterium]
MLKKIMKYFFLFIAVVLIALPYAAKYGAIHYLETEKNIRATIGDLDFNVFSGRFALEDVHFYGAEVGELHLGLFAIDLNMLELFNKNILIDSIEIRDFNSNVSELPGGWNIGGIKLLLDESEKAEEPLDKSQDTAKPFDWGYGIRSLSFSRVLIDVSSQYADSQFEIRKFAIKDALSWFPATASGVELDLAINGNNLNINGDAKPFAKAPVLSTSVVIDNVQLKPFFKSLKNLPVSDVDAGLFADLTLDVAMENKGLQVLVNGNYGLRNIFMEDELRKIKLEKLMLNGEQKLILGDDVDITASLSLALEKMDIESLDGNVKLASIDSFNANNIQVKNIDDIIIDKSELKKLHLVKELNKNLPDMLRLDKLLVSHIRYQPDLAEVEKVELRHLVGDIRLNDKGEVPVLASIIANDSDEKSSVSSAKAEEVKSAGSRFAFAVKEILISPDSNIRFVDNSVTPVFDTKLHDLKLKIVNVNSADTRQAANIDFSVNIDEYGNMKIKGDLQPFSDKINAKIVANLEALELVPLSSYAGKFAGINIQRGTMSLDAKIDIKDDELDVKNTFFLNQLKVESDDAEVKDNIFKDMPMPLDLTLDVLRDNNNVIKLDIPVKGNINNPDFRLQDVYNKAMAKAMKFAATHYLMQAVQPLGLILTAGELIKKAAAPKFEPLKFALGAASVSKENKKHVDKIAKLLKERDKLRLTICGFSVNQDWDALKKKLADKGKPVPAEKDKTKQLLKLANRRAHKIKDYFISTHKISVKRLFSCNGKVLKEEKIPKVEISL